MAVRESSRKFITRMVIRAATVDDAQGIAEVHVASWKAAYRGLLPDSLLDGLSVPNREELWRRIVAENKFPVLVAVHDVRTVGFVSFGRTRDPDGTKLTGEILAIYVDPINWRQGIGQVLLDAALSELKSSGSAEVTLWVLESNERGRLFYTAAGFSLDADSKKASVEDNCTIHEVRYRRRL